MKKVLKTIAQLNILVGAILMIIPIGVLILLNVAPQNDLLAAFDPKKEDAILNDSIIKADSEINTKPKYTFTDPFTTPVPVPVKEKPLEFAVTDAVSTTGATIQIGGIKVDTLIHESTNLEAALVQGVWRDPKYGTPDNNDLPIILAAHRWGENTFSWDFRNKNLFTEFDQLKGGEIVTINWNNKVYKYRIDSIETLDHVTKLADLIMYTCVDYYSSQRLIVYATRI